MTERLPGFERAWAQAEVFARRQAVLARCEPAVVAWFERCLQLQQDGQAMAIGEICPDCLRLVPARPGAFDMDVICCCEPARNRVDEWAAAHGITGLLPILAARYDVDESIRGVA